MSGQRDDPGGRRPPACPRTKGILDRIVADGLTADDRAHAATCEACGPVVSRSMRFDTELRQAARGFVAEELPRDILDPGLVRGLGTMDRGRSARAFAPGMAGIAAALVIVILAATNAIAPGGPSARPSVPAESSFTSTLPVFRSSVSIIKDMQRLKYVCRPGHELATAGPDPDLAIREGVVCTTVKEDTEKMASLVGVQNEAGDIVAVSIKGDLVGTTVAATQVLSDAIAKLTFVAIADPVVAPEAAEIVKAELPKLQVLPTGDDTIREVGGIRITMSRDQRGSYLLYLEPAPPG
jgi:hypothetical protein